MICMANREFRIAFKNDAKLILELNSDRFEC